MKKKQAEKEAAEQKKASEKEQREQERAQKKKEAEEKKAADKANRDRINAEKSKIRKDAQDRIHGLRQRYNADMKRLDKEITHAKELLRDAINKERDAFDAADSIADTGAYNPNGAMPGRQRGTVGPESNNTDNVNGGAFAQSKSFLPNWIRSHPQQAAALGMEAGLSSREQQELNALDMKAAGGQELSDSQKRRRA